MTILRPILRPLLSPILRHPLDPSYGSLEAATRAMFAASEPGVMYDLTRASTLYQDSGRTTLVSANGDPIGSVTDLSPNLVNASQATAASRPLWQGYGDFDGVDDSVVTPAIDFTGTAQITVVASFKPESTATSILIESQSGSTGLFGVVPNYTSAGKIAFLGAGTGGTDSMETTAATYGNGVTTVVALSIDLSKTAAAQKLVARINATAGLTSVAADNADTPGMGGNVPLHIGRRSNNTIPFTGRIYRLLVIGRALTAAELTTAEAWANQPVRAF